MSPALIQVVPYMGVMFASYDTLKRVAQWGKRKSGINTTATTEQDSSKDLSSKSVSHILLGLEDLICGGLSGVISKTCVYPLDIVRKRLQIQGSEQQKLTAKIYSPSLSSSPSSSSAAAAVSPTSSSIPASSTSFSNIKPSPIRLPTSVWRCILFISKTEGFLSLYKGLAPGLIKAAPSSATTFLVFSQAGTFVEKYLRPYYRHD
jgi:solute carrier family 25 thiamine pyrophosphate transporter 19